MFLVYISTLQHPHKRACNLGFAKGGGLKTFCLKNASIRWRAEQSGATQSSHREGSGGEAAVAGRIF